MSAAVLSAGSMTMTERADPSLFPQAVRACLAAAAELRTVSPFLFLLPLVVALIFFTVARELRPLVGLAHAVGGRTPEALDPIPAMDVPAEVRPLVDALNDLLARLRAALDAQRDFVADAAHELRTPLAALQLQAGLIERSTDADERQAAIGELKAGVAREARRAFSSSAAVVGRTWGAPERILRPSASLGGAGGTLPIGAMPAPVGRRSPVGRAAVPEGRAPGAPGRAPAAPGLI